MYNICRGCIMLSGSGKTQHIIRVLSTVKVACIINLMTVCIVTWFHCSWHSLTSLDRSLTPDTLKWSREEILIETNNLIRFSLFVRGWHISLHNVCVVFNSSSSAAVIQNIVIFLDYATVFHENKVWGMVCRAIDRCLICR